MSSKMNRACSRREAIGCIEGTSLPVPKICPGTVTTTSASFAFSNSGWAVIAQTRAPAYLASLITFRPTRVTGQLTISRSPRPITGVVVSKTTQVSNPLCLRRMAKPRMEASIPTVDAHIPTVVKGACSCFYSETPGHLFGRTDDIQIHRTSCFTSSQHAAIVSA